MAKRSAALFRVQGLGFRVQRLGFRAEPKKTMKQNYNNTKCKTGLLAVAWVVHVLARVVTEQKAILHLCVCV